ncbi:endonuclease VIII Nei2 [Mycolicibacterium sarraceniae]|uniref:DNA-(apurinic or apyrimidinic site) lyase n=1 Tax=Mycolicibacterium sarraceniae TaxID=1534348 RepID=A0A7I7SNB0_9MYCO|nr:endonuclease VIII Nei2 [Mycolicibacterium sarraceniae]BBY57336.1 endonuclease VIII [Mycolicibacterium sarraceniae]
MPEGDTVFRTAANLRDALVGKTLTRCDVRVPRYATVDLTGSTVDEVISRGKHLFVRVGSASIHSHLKMDGAWRVGPKGRPQRQAYKIRIFLEAADIQALGIDLGVLEILDRDNDMDAVAHLGPDLLGDDWDHERAAANLTADPDRPLAQALLDQRNLAGVGNVYANELCFIFGRLPTTPVSSLTDPLRTVNQAQKMLWANRTRVNRTTTGNNRRGQELWVYGRAGEPCRRCGTPIRCAESSEEDRVTYWCPSCQR